MCREYVERCASEMISLATRLNWTIVEIRTAITGSVYIDLRRANEWVTIRVADHAQVYHKHMTTYSFAPGNMFYEQFEILLAKPYGEVGDIYEETMNDDVKLILEKEGKAMTCYPYRYPYSKDDVIKDGIPFEEWIKIAGEQANERGRSITDIEVDKRD